MDTVKSIMFLGLAIFCGVWITCRLLKALLKFIVGIMEIIFCFITAALGGWELLQWACIIVAMLNIVRFIRRKAKFAALKKKAYLD